MDFRERANMMVAIAVAIVTVGLVGLGYYYNKALKPQPPKKRPVITSPRVQLSDGRHLAYTQLGVPKQEAKHHIIVIHGFGSSKDQHLPVPQEVIEDLKIHLVYFDRAGYGESDPHPRRSVKSEAFDVQELADKLEIGPKFHVVGISMGGYPVWSCLKYIPHRLCGAALVVPFVNYWWPCFPSRLSREAFGSLARSDRWTFRVARYAPWLFYWWMTQRWFAPLALLSENSDSVLTAKDVDIFRALPGLDRDKIVQQGVHECLHRDIMVGFGRWEFDPADVADPFRGDEGTGSVHIWQGYEDKIIPFELNRYLSEKLPWVRYHEVADGGHAFVFQAHMCEAVLKALLLP